MMKPGFNMTAGTRIALTLLGYAVAVFLALHSIFGIEFWHAALWTPIIVIASAILVVVIVLFALNDSKY